MFRLPRRSAATHPRIPCPIIAPEHLPQKPNGEHGGCIGLRSVSHHGNIAQCRRRRPSVPASDGRVSERLAALRAAEFLGDAFKELQEPVAALAAPVPAVGLRDGQVHDAQLLASLAEGQPAPVARAACLSPSRCLLYSWMRFQNNGVAPSLVENRDWQTPGAILHNVSRGEM